MVTTSLNWVDYIIIGIFSFSILAGLFRGLIREVIALITWISAFVVSGYFANDLAQKFTGGSGQQSPFSSSAINSMGFNTAKSVSLISVSVSFVLLFILTLVIGSLINYFISRAVDAGGISIGNRLLGGVFGLLRGFLINLVIIFLVQLSPLSQQPIWTSSQFVTAFQPAVKWLENLVYPGIESLKNNLGPKIKNLNTQSFENVQSLTSQIYQNL